uniref:Uncharacterized protein n=1 Tax=Rhizophora mucronata TaxID=61149 RepID=A0A2P2L3M5_RHIMU
MSILQNPKYKNKLN